MRKRNHCTWPAVNVRLKTVPGDPMVPRASLVGGVAVGASSLS